MILKRNRLTPNFFIVGGQRCGTTAMSTYLRSHPDICFSSHKEPHYFAEDLPGVRKARSLEEYLNLFKSCGGNELAVGESSTGYLQSSRAIANIYEFNPQAKIIVMLRNPVDLVHSLHAHLFYCGHEDKEDFEKAWRLQGVRNNGKNLPKDPRYHTVLQYVDVGKLGFQIERLLSIFPREQVKIILFEDFIESPREIYEQVLFFLGVPSDGRTEFPIANENRELRFPFLFKLYRNNVPWRLQCLLDQLRRKTGLKILRRYSLFSTAVTRPRLSADMRSEIITEFADDIIKLSTLLSIDLNHWLERETTGS